MRLTRRGRRRLLLVTSLGVTLLVAAVAFKGFRSVQKNRLVAAALEEGLAAHARDDLDVAVEKLSYFIQHDKTNIDAMLAFADARLRLPLDDNRHVGEALGLYKHALKLLDADPAWPGHDERRLETMHALVDLYGMVGLRFEQVESAEAILAVDPSNVHALSARAISRFVDRRFEDALGDAERLASLQPEQLSWRQLQLETMHRLGATTEAIEARCREWIETAPPDGRFHVLLAGLLAADGRGAEARVVITEAVAAGAGSLEVLEAMVATLDELQMRDVAAEAVGAAKTRFPRAQWVRQAIIKRHWQGGSIDAALAEYDAATAEFETLETDLLQLGVLVLAASPRRAEAEAGLRALLARSDEGRRDEKRLAWCRAIEARLRLDDATWNEAVRSIDYALALQAGDPALHMARGEAYARVNEWTEAGDSFAAAYELDPNWISAGLACVDALLRVGRADDAFLIAGDVIRRSETGALGPYVAYARAFLAVIENGGDVPIAGGMESHARDLIRVFEGIREQLPEQVEVVAVLVESYLGVERDDDAKRLIREILEMDAPAPGLLLSLAGICRRHDIDLERTLVERTRATAGLTLPVALALATLESDAQRDELGLDLIDRAIASADSATARSIGVQRARVDYMVRMEHPRAAAELRAFMRGFPNVAAAQSYVLSVPLTWEQADVAEEAIVNLETVLGTRSEQPRLARARFLVRFHGDDEARLAEAIMMLAEVLEQRPDSLAALTFMAEASLLGAHPSETRAIEHLERAIEVAPGQLGLYTRLIALLQERGEYEAASRYLERMAPRIGRDERLRRAELRLLQRQGDFETALVRASTLYDASDDETDQLALAAMLRQTGRLDRAESIYATLLEGTPGPVVIVQAADFFAATGRLARGQQLLLDMAPGDDRMNKALLLGLLHERHGSAESAEEWMRRAKEEAPDSATVRHELARFHLQRGDREAARAEATAGLRLDPAHTGLKRTLALSNLGAERAARQRAIATLREAGDDDDDFLALLLLLERIEHRDGEPVVTNEILIAAQALVNEHGGLPAAWTLASRLFLQAGRVDDAVDLARRSVGRFPANPEPARQASELLAAVGRTSEALVEAQEWRRRTLHEPLPADVAIAQLLLAAGRPAEAIDQLEPHAQRLSLERRREPGRLEVYLEALVAGGRADLAAALVVPLLDHEPTWRERWWAVADRLDGDAGYAALSLVSAGALADEAEKLRHAMAWYRLGVRSGRADALDRADAMARSVGDDPRFRVDAVMMRGAVAEAREAWPAAEAHFRQVLATEPGHVFAANNLAHVLARNGRAAEALPIIERVNTARPDNPDLMDTWALALRGVGRYDEAERMIRAALARRTDPGIMMSLVEVLMDRGDHDAARDALEEAERLMRDRSRTTVAETRRLQRIRDRVTRMTAVAE